MDENKLDIPIGGRFNWCRIVYEVRVGASCRDCSFWSLDHNVCTASNYVHFPFCGWFLRKDGISVIFVCVGAEGEAEK